MAGDDRTVWRDVQEAERAQVQARRGEQRDAEAPLVGLAISGGGIRSATFGLGVLESLKQLRLLRALDYLSTVSGGGYIGAWLTAGCRRHRGWLDPAADWHDAIVHLRRYSNYLSPAVGFFSADTWSMVTIWLRNTLLIQATVILAIACALLVPRPFFELFRLWPALGWWRWASILLFVIGIVGIAGNEMRLTSGARPLLRARNWPRSLAGGAVCLAAAWLFARQTGFDPFHSGEVSYLRAVPVAALVVLAGFVLQPFGVRVAALLRRGPVRPEQVNYTQGDVQAFVVLPLMIAAALVSAVLWGEAIGAPGVTEGLSTLNSYGALLTTAGRYWPFPLAVVFVSFWLLSFLAIDSRAGRSGLLTSFWAPCVAVAVLHALLCAVMLLLRGWASTPAAAAANAVHAFVWAPPLVAVAFALSIVVLIGMLGRESTDEVREWWSRLGAWLGIYATAWMLIAVSAVYGPAAVRWVLGASYWTSLTASGGFIATVVGGLLAGNSESTDGTATRSASTRAKEAVAVVAPFVFIAGLLLGVGWVLDSVLRSAAAATWTTGAAANHTHLIASLAALAACAGALVLMAWRIDINLFSLNSFYRNRLVRCYLGATRQRSPQNFTGFDGDDDIPLAALAGSAEQPCDSPLHLVNCALNLGGSSDLALHTRHSASFTMSPLYCGSAYKSRDQAGHPDEVGYLPTRAYGGPFGAPTLGQAISVSGAAASPNMGYHTSPVTAFLLTLFNVRLGWWFPNPLMTRARVASPSFSLAYLLAELFGGATDRSSFVMISDGGHFENLAAYELIRRRCRVIVISDGECDEKLAFQGLGTLVRMCEVDFGVRIAIDVKALRPAAGSPWSASRFAIGTIDYGAGQGPGTLIYLKASMTGNEDTPVLQYKASHPAFPHESTGDQFYREDQFESYRQLGRDVALEGFAALATTAPQVASLLATAAEAGAQPYLNAT